MPIFWDADNHQYLREDEASGNGPVAFDEVRGLSAESLAASRAVVDQWVEDFFEGDLSAAGLNEKMRQEIKEEYIRQYLLAHGGRDTMTAADWGSIGGMVGSQYSPYLNDFTAALEAGEVGQGAAEVRAGMYVNSAREAFERAHSRVMVDAGATEERWVLGVAEHCDDCIELADLGWQTIGSIDTFPGQGDTQCLTNCQCHMEYRNAAGEIVG